MKRGRLSCVALVFVLTLSRGVIVAAPAPLPDVDSCVRVLDPQLDIGYDRIAARCPDLARELEHGAWSSWLPRGWKESGNDLSAGGLKEFRNLVSRESTASDTGRPTPDVDSLKRVLATLAPKSSTTAWSRFKSWLRSILERPEQSTDEGWFTRMNSHVGVPQSVRQVIAYTALGVVVLLAGGIVINELRAAGMLPKNLRSRRGVQTIAASNSAALSWSDVERAPMTDRPGLLLGLIVRRLNDRDLLPPAGALTVRELTRVARLPEPEDRTRLSDLALAAERVRFSGHEPRVDELDVRITRGRELLSRLEADV